MTRPVLACTTILALLLARGASAQQTALTGDRGATAAAPDRGATAAAPDPVPVLAPTSHPRLPLDITQLWLAPNGGSSRGTGALGAALKLFDNGSDEQALSALLQAGAQQGALGYYALYYAGRAQQRLGRHADALRTFRLIQQRDIVGYLREAAAIGEAEALEATGEHRAAADIYERLSNDRPLALDEIVMRLGNQVEAAGDAARAMEAYARVYYEFPMSDLAALAKARLDSFPGFQPIARGNQRFKLEMGRAQRLFGARLYGPAKSTFEALRLSASGDDREVVDLRIAESDYYFKRYRQARDGVKPYTDSGARQAEALYFEAVASRALGDSSTYLKNVRRIIEAFPEQTWGEEGLNDLATQYIRQDDDAAADGVFREMLQRYPRGSYAERAAWKVGWRSFREGRSDEAAQLFERAAADFPRSNFRPAWLFWSGRAYEQSEKAELARARYSLTATDYLNTYYGRLAVERLNGRVPPPRVIADPSAPAPTPAVPSAPNELIVRALLDNQRYDDALNEVKYAQRHYGDSAALQATTAWIYRQQGLAASGRDQFNLLRGSITTMRRAYPQFMAAGGEYLPKEVLSIIFPMSYWDEIRRHATANGLDPYLVAALVAQESTFVPDVRSPANAVGLMQLIPSTARVYARKLGLRYSTRLLTNPEANIRMGTAYLADKVREFGDLHLVLASYNAGERAVRRWMSERPGLPIDEFIDDIPYPETQNYVKRILGTADDYRRLYGNARVPPLSQSSFAPGDDEIEELVVPAVAPAGAATVQRATTATPVKPATAKRATAKASSRTPAKKAPAKRAPAKKTPAGRRSTPRG